MRHFQETPNSVSFPEVERKLLAQWQKEQTFSASVSLREGQEPYVFYDGPPFATGLPHYGHLLTSYIKDVVPRYFTMKGRFVPRRWGWDCHGLPVEREAERELNLQSKQEIEARGVALFTQTCRGLVLRYADEWQKCIDRLGRWVDFAGGYRTMDLSYMESVVWAFHSLYQKGLLYEGTKVVAYCWRCQTPLSHFEVKQDDAYRPRQDVAATVAFALSEEESLLAWTTTPWTLPANVALAVSPGLAYVRLEREGRSVWLAESALPRYQKALEGYQPKEKVPGEALVGRRYQPLFPFFAETPNAFVVLASDHVTAGDGTGVVHLAPSYGEEDSEVCQRAGLTGPSPVQDDGRFDQSVGSFSGLPVFSANEPILQALRASGRLFQKESYTHNYPHCWRCDNPLIYRAVSSWFVKVTALKERLLSANAKIRWAPAHIKEGRFGDWLANARDWAVSRSRYWGSPVPVWRCSNCKQVEVFGSVGSLAQRAGREVSDLHRPAIDEVAFGCACGGELRRVPEVLDCWFESGAMPFAQLHYPFENQELFTKSFPGDFIVEYVAQTRGWFYTLLVLSVALFDAPPFRSALCHGVILGHDGRKMSKRLRNYPDPMEMAEEHGSDALRAALLTSAVASGSDAKFSAELVRDAARRFCLPLWNSLHLFTTYATLDGFSPEPSCAFLEVCSVPSAPVGRLQASSLDRYLLHQVEVLRSRLEHHLERYDLPSCYEALENFIEVLSGWYLRLVKPTLWRSGLDAEKRAVYETLFLALSTLSKLAAPFLPFLAEALHQALGGETSVHLCDWPTPQPNWEAPALNQEMQTVREIVRLARVVRERHKVGLRQPLQSASVAGVSEALLQQYKTLLEEELNVKEVRPLASLPKSIEQEVVLDYPLLGKKLREAIKPLAAQLTRGEFTLLEDGSLQAGAHTLSPNEFSLRFTSKEEGLGVAAQAGCVVVLDLSLDKELELEGKARQLNRALQELRKKAKLSYQTTIEASLEGPPGLKELLEKFGGWLKEQTLAQTLSLAPLPEPLATSEAELGDLRVTLALRSI